MPTILTYELWKGEQVVGHYYSTSPVMGTTLIIPEISSLKQPYDQKIKEIHIPISWRHVSDDGVTMTFKRVLDVTKKSKRQIRIIQQSSML
jgi:hypothetical protein